MNQPPQKLLKAYKYAYKLKAGGKTPEEIKQALLAQSFDDKSARAIIETIEHHYDEKKSKLRKSNILYGTFWCSGGIIAAGLIYINPRVNIFPYLIALGAISFGVIRIFTGLLQKKK